MRRIILAVALLVSGCGEAPERSRLSAGQRFIVVGDQQHKAYAEDMKDGYLRGIELGIYGTVIEDSGDIHKETRPVIARFQADDIGTAKIERRSIRPTK